MATGPRLHSRRLSRLILVAVCAFVVGCGDDSSSSQDAGPDQQQILTAVERLMESERVEDQCVAGVSPRFVREVYSTLALCRSANKPDGDDDPPDKVTIAATRIDGDEATTGLTLTSARGARATGRLALVKVAGTWKVDRLGVGFLRSIFEALPKQAESAHERIVLECLAVASRELSSRDVRRFGNLVIGRRLAPEAFPVGALTCIRRRAQQPSPTV